MAARETMMATTMPLASLVVVFTKAGQEKTPRPPMTYCMTWNAPSTPPATAEMMQLTMKGVFLGRVMP